ncbi:MAG: Fic family protein [Candidatus Shapirobacteria bacterium]|jgi:fido (protein-threonine AMPylation protein)
MNETQLTPREKAIINILAQGNPLSRQEISQQLISIHPVSKLTLIRDLNHLIGLGMVTLSGQSRDTQYQLTLSHPLLAPIDINTYFATEPDIRLPSPKTFDIGLLAKLSGLFSPTEKKQLERQVRSFTRETNKLGPNIMLRELERFVIELSWKSSKIEGNTYSLLETETLIKESRQASGKSSWEATMILNHKRVFEMILKERASLKTVSLSSLTQLHNTIVAGLNVTSGVRHIAVGVTGTNYRPLDNQWQIKDALSIAIKAINQAEFPLEKALLAVVLIAYIQPFVDGNKRTGRMLANALLIAHDWFPLSYRSIREEEYKEALILFYEQGNLYHLKRLMVEQFQFAQKTYFL